MSDAYVNNISNPYASTEFAEVVTALYFGIDFIGIEQDSHSSNKVIFLFERTPTLDKVVREFWNDTVQVSPKKWHATSRELKARIRAELSLKGVRPYA